MDGDYYQRIGQAAVAACSGAEHILLYAEVEEGVSSADLFYLAHDEGVVRFHFASDALRHLVVEFWEIGDGMVFPRSWFALEFAILGAKFNVKYTYREQVNLNEDLSDRRPLVVERHFPSLKIDYSRPEG